MLYEHDLRLRPISLPDDIALALPWYQDQEVLYYSEGSGTEPYSAETVERMYRWLSKEGHVYIIEAREEDRWLAIGDATLRPDVLPIVIGDPRFRSRGLGAKVLALLVGQARQLGWERLRAHKIYAYNERSQRLFERQGFVRSGSGVDDEGRPFYQYELTLR